MSNPQLIEVETITTHTVKLDEPLTRVVRLADNPFEIHKIIRTETLIPEEWNGVEGEYHNVTFKVWGYPLTRQGMHSARYENGKVESVYPREVEVELNKIVNHAIGLDSLTSKPKVLKVHVYDDIPFDESHTWTVTGNFALTSLGHEDNHDFEDELRKVYTDPDAKFDSEAGQFFAYVRSYDKARQMTIAIGEVLGEQTKMVLR